MKVVSFFIVGLLAMAYSSQTIAHTKLKESFPEDGSVIFSSPSELKLIFNGKVKLMKVDLRTEGGTKIKLAFKLSPVSSDKFSIPLSQLTEDGYVVSWIAMGKDSHKMKGKFTFKIQSEIQRQ